MYLNRNICVVKMRRQISRYNFAPAGCPPRPPAPASMLPGSAGRLRDRRPRKSPPLCGGGFIHLSSVSPQLTVFLFSQTGVWSGAAPAKEPAETDKADLNMVCPPAANIENPRAIKCRAAGRNKAGCLRQTAQAWAAHGRRRTISAKSSIVYFASGKLS